MASLELVVIVSSVTSLLIIRRDFASCRSLKYNARKVTESSSTLSSRAILVHIPVERWKARVERVKALDEESFMRNIKSQDSASFVYPLSSPPLPLPTVPLPLDSSVSLLRVPFPRDVEARRVSLWHRNTYPAACLIFDTQTRVSSRKCLLSLTRLCQKSTQDDITTPSINFQKWIWNLCLSQIVPLEYRWN